MNSLAANKASVCLELRWLIGFAGAFTVHNLGRNTSVLGSSEAACGAGAIFPQKTGELLGFCDRASEALNGTLTAADFVATRFLRLHRIISPPPCCGLRFKTRKHARLGTPISR